MVVSVHHLLIEADFKFRIPNVVGSLDAITSISLILATLSGWFAFQQIRMADTSNRDAKQHSIKEEIIREVNEGKQEIDCVSQRVTDLEKESYALRLNLQNHIDWAVHPEAAKKFL
ncbi:hypothetical protein [Mastigocladopsis repens]|uniref:hypothetical protein n=1 Tax=Mastigocladopsis repens TaxID=221287 RepID=UPI00037B6653|nr:hypothetical protein [Mastigocladopsis repens]